MVQELQRIRNQEANVAKLNDSLLQLEAAFEAGRIGNRLQVDQARQALFNGQSRLLAAKSSFANRLDGYKMFLGLPPDLSMRVMDDYIESFRLTDSELVELQDEVNRILSANRNPDEVSTRESLLKSFNRIKDAGDDSTKHERPARFIEIPAVVTSKKEWLCQFAKTV